MNSSEFMDIEILITKDIWKEANPPQIDSFIYAKVYFAGEILDLIYNKKVKSLN